MEEQKKSILFRLPPEIRVMIYRLVLKKDGAVPICGQPYANVTPAVDGKLVRFPPEDCERGNRRIEFEMDRIFREPWVPSQEEKVRCRCSLLATCKKIHAEATPVLYSANMLVIDDQPESAIAWMTSIGDNVKYIKRLAVWINITVMMAPLAWRELNIVLYRAQALNQVTVLFQKNARKTRFGAWYELHSPELASLWNSLKWVDTETPRAVEIGFYPTLGHAYDALEHEYR